ncbi:MAG TPA: HAD family hydrolase [Clostridiaceae bacterium]|nr:HAD family hydrolase [Clostridiaceae bacterium]
MSQFKAVIFDLDGTLLDTIEDLADSMNAVLAEAGYPLHGIQSYKYFVGKGMKNLVYNALPPEHRNEETIKVFTQKMKEEYAKRWNVKTRPYDGIPELLDILEVKRIDKAVLSNKPDNFTKIIIKELLPKWKFAVVFGERDSIPRKPDPTGALEIAHILNLKPHEILYLGDTGTDMKTAVSAGMYAVGALWGFREKDELIANGAKVVIEHPLELLNLL